MNQVQKVYKLLTAMKSRSSNGSSLKNDPMILNENKFGYDPDEYDDEPSDYVNSETAYTEDDLSKDTAEEFEEDDDEFVDVDDDEDLDELDNEVLDDSDVDEDDPINDDVSDYPSSNPAAFHQDDKKPVYIKDMPYIDHARPGVTSH
jgi:hypothetical protein